MKVLFSVILLLGAFYFIWWGYKNLVKRERRGDDEEVEGAICTLCGRAYPISEVVTVEKKAGFENYFCGSCIAKLAAEYNDIVRAGDAPAIYEDHILDGNNGNVVRYN
jgi:transcription elongation factor Elf1